MNNTNIITNPLLKAGYKQNIVNIIDTCGGIMCAIGDYSFFFAGIEGEETTAWDYESNTPVDDIIDEILSTLEAFRNDDDFQDEYEYYYFYLIENVKNGTEVNKAVKKVFNIKWDTDGDEEILATLPTEVFIPDDIKTIDEASDYITDKIGFCHYGFETKGF